jgi:hypothetical protein
MEDLSVNQARQLRRTRCANEKLMGRCKTMIEPVAVLDIHGNRITAVGEFKYLGTLVGNRGGATIEVMRRIQIAAPIFSRLRPIWNSTLLPLTLKLRLFSAVVASVLLYNSQCWAVTANDLRLLEGFYFRCLRYLTRRIRCPLQSNAVVVDKASKTDVFRVANVPTVAALLRERRLRWLGHLLRAGRQDTARQCLMQEVGSCSSWWRIVQHDLQAVGIDSIRRDERLAADRVRWRAMTSARPGQHQVLRL